MVTPSPAPPSADAPEAAPPLRELLQRELGGEIAIGSEVARGALTVTFIGTETRTGHKVVIDTMPADAPTGRGTWTDRVLRAARVGVQLRHPHIVPVHRVAAGDRLCWYVSKHVDGESLERLLERECQLPLARAIDITARIGTALGYAHDHGVVHGDVTPRAVSIDARGFATVRDFGLLRAAQGPDAPDGAVPSSPHYLAPELCGEGTQSPSAASDQYALAVIAWQMLAGNLPFIGQSDEDVRRQQRLEPVPPLGYSRTDLPKGVPTVLERALAKKPQDRYPSVARFVAALKAAARDAMPARRTPPEGTRRTPTEGTRRAPETLLMMPPTSIFPQALSAFAPLGLELREHLNLRRGLAIGLFVAMVVLVWWAGRAPSAPEEFRDRDWIAAGRRAAPRQDSVASSAVPSETTTSAGTSAAVAAAPRPSLPTATPPVAPAPRVTAAPARRASEPRRSPPPRRLAAPRRREATDEPTPVPVRPSAPAYVTVGTNVQAVIYINDQAVPTNPVRNWPVRSGLVTIRFQVMDTAAGVWQRDTVVVLNAGDTLNLHRIHLTHP